MLRPLQIFEHDAKGNMIFGEDGRPVPLKGKNAGQPIPLDKLPLAFHKYWKKREEDLAVQRYQAKIAREQILRAAQLDLATKSGE